MLRASARAVEPHRGLSRAAYAAERGVKRTLFDCRECGDCALPDIFFLCPESQCPKGMRNGPCGGSRANGMCEVFPDTPCIWERVYWRAKRRGKVGTLDFIIPPRDWRLYKTASWLTFYLKRDHGKEKLMLAPPGRAETPVSLEGEKPPV
jgi:methylenetetrahydrofolate reductase (NADPH)